MKTFKETITNFAPFLTLLLMDIVWLHLTGWQFLAMVVLLVITALVHFADGLDRGIDIMKDVYNDMYNAQR